jgi:hypothetical protein
MAGTHAGIELSRKAACDDLAPCQFLLGRESGQPTAGLRPRSCQCGFAARVMLDQIHFIHESYPVVPSVSQEAGNASPRSRIFSTKM